MLNLNRVFISGNLTRDPESRAVGEHMKCSFTVAVDGYKEGTVHYVDVEAWRRQGELVQAYLTKGSGALVEGRLEQQRWTAEDGSKRSRFVVVADRVHFGERSQKSSGTDPASPPASPVTSNNDEPPF